MILVDTSVWIETFRINRPLDLTAHVDLEEVVLCLPVFQEILQGFRDERAYRHAREALLAFPMVESPMRLAVVEDAIGLFRAAGRQGLTIRSSMDCLIAACAIRHDLTVLHRDRDYPLLAKVSPLRQRSS